METKLPFRNNKPDKDGVWLFKVDTRDNIGVIVVSGDIVIEMQDPHREYTCDVWWNILPDKTLMYFVG